jgi:penicillin amidase
MRCPPPAISSGPGVDGRLECSGLADIAVCLGDREIPVQMTRLLSRLIFVVFCVVPSAWSAGPLARLVTIYRDNFGVPHIVGETEQAVFFGYGYAQAQDHLERMMLQYRDAQG